MNKITLKTVDREVEGEKIVLTLKSIDSAEAKATSASEGIMTFYASVFGNVDSYGDIMQRGAFAKAIDAWKTNGKYPKVVWNHNWDEPLGKVIDMLEDEYGLKVTVEFNMDVARAKEIWSLYKQGALTDFSFGYSVTADEYDNEGHRLIKEVRLYEVSPVLIGANNATHVVAMKTETNPGDAPPEPGAEGTTPPLPPEGAQTTPPEGNPEGEGAEAGQGTGEPDKATDEPTEEKAGRMLSAKNKELVTTALTSLKAVQDATTGFGDLIKALEALLNATESSEPDKGKDGHEMVDQPTKNAMKIVLRQAQRAVKEQTSLIVKIKTLSK